MGGLKTEARSVSLGLLMLPALTCVARIIGDTTFFSVHPVRKHAASTHPLSGMSDFEVRVVFTDLK